MESGRELGLLLLGEILIPISENSGVWTRAFVVIVVVVAAVVLFVCLFVCFQTGFLCVALAVLELTL